MVAPTVQGLQKEAQNQKCQYKQTLLCGGSTEDDGQEGKLSDGSSYISGVV